MLLGLQCTRTNLNTPPPVVLASGQIILRALQTKEKETTIIKSIGTTKSTSHTNTSNMHNGHSLIDIRAYGRVWLQGSGRKEGNGEV